MQGQKYQIKREPAELDELWSKIGEVVKKEIVERMREKKLLSGDDEGLYVTEAFDDTWKIKTKKTLVYLVDRRVTEEEVIEEIVGRLVITKWGEPVGFPFVFHIKRRALTAQWEESLTFDQTAAKKIIEEIKELEKRQEKEFTIGKDLGRRMEVYNKQREQVLGKVLVDVKDALHNHWKFSHDEVNLMVHNAVASGDFRDGMDPGEIVGLALRHRGDSTE